MMTQAEYDVIRAVEIEEFRKIFEWMRNNPPGELYGSKRIERRP